MTQNKAKRASKIAFFPLPWAQEVPSSNLGAPTKNISRVFFYLLKVPFTSNPMCEIPSGRSAKFASRLVSESFAT